MAQAQAEQRDWAAQAEAARRQECLALRQAAAVWTMVERPGLSGSTSLSGRLCERLPLGAQSALQPGRVLEPRTMAHAAERALSRPPGEARGLLPDAGRERAEPWLSGCRALSGELSGCRADVRHCQVPMSDQLSGAVSAVGCCRVLSGACLT